MMLISLMKTRSCSPPIERKQNRMCGFLGWGTFQSWHYISHQALCAGNSMLPCGPSSSPTSYFFSSSPHYDDVSWGHKSSSWIIDHEDDEDLYLCDFTEERHKEVSYLQSLTVLVCLDPSWVQVLKDQIVQSHACSFNTLFPKYICCVWFPVKQIWFYEFF